MYPILSLLVITEQKMKFSIKHFFGKYERIRKLSTDLFTFTKKSLTENFIFYAMNKNPW